MFASSMTGAARSPRFTNARLPGPGSSNGGPPAASGARGQHDDPAVEPLHGQVRAVNGRSSCVNSSSAAGVPATTMSSTGASVRIVCSRVEPPVALTACTVTV